MGSTRTMINIQTDYQTEPWTMDAESDYLKELMEAAKKVELAGSEKPLIMEELKTKIQLERAKKGLPELKVEFEKPPTYELTDAEKANKKKRQQRNRAAAKKSRNRKKAEYDLLMENHTELYSLNTNLKSEVNELTELLNKLKRGARNARICSNAYSRHPAKHVPFMLQSSKRALAPVNDYHRVTKVRRTASSSQLSAASIRNGSITPPRSRNSSRERSLSHSPVADIERELVSIANNFISAPASVSVSAASASPAYIYKRELRYPKTSLSAPATITTATRAPFPSSSPPITIPVTVPLMSAAGSLGFSLSDPAVFYSSPMDTSPAYAYASDQVYQQQNHLDVEPFLKLIDQEHPPPAAGMSPTDLIALKELLPSQYGLAAPSPHDKLVGSGHGSPSPPAPAPSISPDHLSDAQYLFSVMQGLNRGA